MASFSYTKVTPIYGEGFYNNSRSLQTAKKAIQDRSVTYTPNFMQLRKQKKHLPVKEYNTRSRRYIYSVGKYYDVNRSTGIVQSVWSGCLRELFEVPYLGGDITFIEPSTEEKLAWTRQAQSKALAKLKRGDLDLAVAFGERKETVRMLENTVKRFVGAARALKRGNFRRCAEYLGCSPLPKGVWRNIMRKSKGPMDLLANGWLEYVYGWKPFVSDVYGALKVFEKPINEPITRVSASVKPKMDDKVLWENTWCRTVTYRNIRVARRVTYYWTIKDAETYFVRSFTDIGLTNPLNLAWELLPFSFVVDWFLPVGNYLSNLDSTIGLKYVDGCLSDRWFRSSVRSGSGKGFSGGGTAATFGSSTDRAYDLWFTRSVLLEPTPAALLPSFKDPLGVSHALSALALLYQTFGRKK